MGIYNLEINCHLTGITDLVGDAGWCPEMQRIVRSDLISQPGLKLYWQKQILESTVGSWVEGGQREAPKDQQLKMGKIYCRSPAKAKARARAVMVFALYTHHSSPGQVLTCEDTFCLNDLICATELVIAGAPAGFIFTTWLPWHN